MKEFTTEEAARRLRTTERNITKLCLDGKIKASRFGKAWKITDEAISDYKLKYPVVKMYRRRVASA